MTNIELYNKGITQVTKNGLVVPIDDLQPNDLEIVKTFSNPTIKQINVNQLLGLIVDVISICYSDLGYKVPTDRDGQVAQAKEISLMAQSVVEKITSDKSFNTLRVVELKKAIKNGSLGDYNTKEWQFVGISAANIIKSVRAYLNSLSRQEEISSYLKLTAPIEESKEPSPEELEKIILSNIKNAFETFKNKGWYDDINNTVFKELYKRGAISEMDDNKIKGFYIKAKERIISEIAIKSETDLMNRKTHLSRLEELKSIKGSEMLMDKDIVIEANKVALNELFKDALEMDMSIEDLLCQE